MLWPIASPPTTEATRRVGGICRCCHLHQSLEKLLSYGVVTLDKERLETNILGHKLLVAMLVDFVRALLDEVLNHGNLAFEELVTTDTLCEPYEVFKVH